MPSSQEDLLGGVWQYRQVADDISIGDDDDDDDVDEDDGGSHTDTDATDTDSNPTPLPQGDIAFFDPLKLSGDANDADEASNEWLLSKMAVLETEVISEASGVGADSSEEYLKCTVTPGGESVEVEMGGTQQDVIQQLLLDSQEVEQTDSAPRPGSVVERGRGDLTSSPLHPSKAVPSPAAAASPQRLSMVNLCDNADYIVLAANQISLAQQCEANGNYQLAFSYYKSGVGILLTGVQSESIIMHDNIMIQSIHIMILSRG